MSSTLTLLRNCILSLLLLIVIICAFRTAIFSQRPAPKTPCRSTDSDFIKLSPEIKDRFQSALRFQTVSYSPERANHAEMKLLQDYIHQAFPLIHSSPLIEHQVINNYSLLYFVTGTEPLLKPYMLCGHIDVVPIINENLWETPPFEAREADGFVVARGTIDDKNTVMGILEAVEFNLARGFRPKRSFYMAFGHDEEIYGAYGANVMGKLIAKRTPELEFILDEGTMITIGVMPGIEKPVALLSVSEKGSLTARIVVEESKEVHSSMPPRETAVGILAEALSRLSKTPHKPQFGRANEWDLMESLAPDMPFGQRIAAANLWLFSPIVSYVFSLKPTTDAYQRTTTAITVLQAGQKHNVIPSRAEAIVNHRIHPSQTVNEIVQKDNEIIGDPRVRIEVLESAEAHPISPHGARDFGYQTIASTVHQIFPDTIVVPGLMIGNTDTQHYLHLSKAIYRFAPTVLEQRDVSRFHGPNERITWKNYEQTINFYHHLIHNADADALSVHKEHTTDL